MIVVRHRLIASVQFINWSSTIWKLWFHFLSLFTCLWSSDESMTRITLNILIEKDKTVRIVRRCACGSNVEPDGICLYNCVDHTPYTTLPQYVYQLTSRTESIGSVCLLLCEHLDTWSEPLTSVHCYIFLDRPWFTMILSIFQDFACIIAISNALEIHMWDSASAHLRLHRNEMKKEKNIHKVIISQRKRK